MRRDLAHSALRSTDDMGNNGKARSVVSKGLGGSGRGAFASIFGPVPQRIEESATNRLAVGWIPTRPATHFSALPAATNYLQGLTSGLRQRQGLLGPTVILTPLPEESNGQNDLPFLPDRMPIGS